MNAGAGVSCRSGPRQPGADMHRPEPLEILRELLVACPGVTPGFYRFPASDDLFVQKHRVSVGFLRAGAVGTCPESRNHVVLV